MKINELSPIAGSRPKAFRKGRGHSTGNGKTAGRGHKGQKARTGGGVRMQFEGGQMPLYRRMPKRGFNHKRFALQYITVNVDRLNELEDGAVVDLDLIAESGIVNVPKVNDGLKILGHGDLKKKLTVKAKAFTASAKEKIENAGGVCEVI